MRNLKATEEYHDTFGAKSYVDAVLGKTNAHPNKDNCVGYEKPRLETKVNKGREDDWEVVTYKEEKISKSG